MSKLPLTFLLASLSLAGATFTPSSARAQSRKKDFELDLSVQKVPNSLYRTIRVLDSRPDTTNMGFAQLGAFNTRARVVPKTPFPKQVQQALDSLNDNTAGDGELLLQMRQFSFSEITKSMSEKGYCFMRLVLYARRGDDYRQLDALDTVLVTKAMDVTKQSAKRGSKALTDFIAANLTRTPSGGDQDAARSFYQVTRIDSLERRRIKVYNTDTFTEGVYRTYASFKEQTPDQQLLKVDYDSGQISTVRIPGKSRKGDKLKNDQVYAIVYQGVPYISTEFYYYPLHKDENGDFDCIGKSRQAPTTGEMVGAGLALGLLGQLLVQGDAVLCEMKIDHISGALIRVRDVQ